MKLLIYVALALVLLTVESVAVKYLGVTVSRIDVTVALVAFLALRASTLEGAIGSFAIGYLVDVMSGRPTSLFIFLAVFVFLLGRLGASLVDVRSGLGFALYAMGCDVVHGLLSTFFGWLVSRGDGGGMASSLTGLPVQVLLTGLAALVLYPLLRRVDPGNDRPQTGVLLS